MKNDTLKNVLSTDKVYKTFDGIRYKVNHLILEFNVSDIIDKYFSCYESKGYPAITDDKDINTSYINQIKQIKSKLIETAYSLNLSNQNLDCYIPFYEIAKIFGEHQYIESFYPNFSFCLMQAFTTIRQ